MVFDSPNNLTQIGAKIVDCQAVGDGWKMKNFSVAELDSLLEQQAEIVPETLAEAAAKEAEDMPELTKLEGAEEGTLRARLYKLLTTGVVPQGFVAQLLQYQCGLIPKRTWTFQIKKPALRGGADPVVMADLERDVEGRYGIRIHRAVYAHLILSKPLDEAIREYRANEGDVKFCIELLPNKTYTEEEFFYKPSFA
jgi:hypothetical protein